MIRFPNPGSDIDQLKNIFDLIYINLSEFEYFDLNNMTVVMTNENVASSSGYIGTEALERSYQTSDFSRNPLYNQAKMYAEVYRFLGWITSTEESSLKYTFTYLGVHVALSGSNFPRLFEQCVLGINYPNQILDVKFKDINYPFISILIMADALDGIICRDEILIGPMNLQNFSDSTEFSEKMKSISKLRSSKNYTNVKNALTTLSTNLNVQVNTMHNYTRFVISTLVYTGWMNKIKSSVYGMKVDFLQLTTKGREVCNYLRRSKVLIGDNLLELDQSDISKISKYSFLLLLKNAGYDVNNDISDSFENFDFLVRNFNTTNIHFSIFQYFDRANSRLYFPEMVVTNGEGINIADIQSRDLTTGSIDYKVLHSENTTEIKRTKVTKFLIDFYEHNNKNLALTIKNLVIEVRKMKQGEFYPLIADLISLVFDVEVRTPQAGVNNERFDLIVLDKSDSVPIEVKSPTEEIMLSVKAIRQALENKIVMMSRYTDYYPSNIDMTSMAVGFLIPNERSDVHRLIEEIYNTYGICISITDVHTLIIASYNCLLNESRFKLNDLKSMKGVIYFENL